MNASRALCAVLIAGSLGACAGMTTVLDGPAGLDAFNRVGDAAWEVKDGVVQASRGGKTPGYLVSKKAYGDFVLRVEFWSSDDANSGVFLRCQDPKKITDESCYEVNIYDQRPDPTYATGGIVKRASIIAPRQLAGGKWNTYELRARGETITVVLNGRKSSELNDAKFPPGPFAFQWGQGTIKFRKVQIRPL